MWPAFSGLHSRCAALDLLGCWHTSLTPCRLISSEDKEYFKRMISELCNKYSLNASYEDLFVNR